MSLRILIVVMAAWLAALVCRPDVVMAAAVISVIKLDGPGEGFNDATPVKSLGGNTGATRGEQRSIAFRYAADIWAAVLSSSVEIEIAARFDPLLCNMDTASLGVAGPNTAHRDFAGAPLAGVWYPQALANALAGIDLDPDHDISATFNSDLGGSCPFPRHWYYGLDGRPGAGEIDFVSSVLHELAHGLGFQSLVNEYTGEKFLGHDDVFSSFLVDASGKRLLDMSDAERVAAMTSTGNLFWVGADTASAAGWLQAGVDAATGYVEMYAPSQPGPASVSHFSNALSPNELMEPFFGRTNHDVGLAVHVLADMGWFCGNGALDFSEGCDDGNTSSGDGCDYACRVEPCFACSGEPSSCVQNTAFCAGIGCPAVMRSNCRAPDAPENAALKLRDRSTDARDMILWQWKGTAPVEEFGDPTTTDEYRLCMYDQGGSLFMEKEVPAGAFWRGTRSGFRYKDSSGRCDGITRIQFRAGVGRARIFVKGKGSALHMPALPDLALPITVQLDNRSTCWEATYDTDLSGKDPRQIKSKAR